MTTLRFGFCMVLTTAIYTSCTKPDITFGADYLDNNYTNIVLADTASVAVSTVYLDSFVTSGSGKALIGNYTDPYFGTVTAEAYFPLVPPAYSDVFSNTGFDSLEMIIKPDKSFYGDTTQPLQIVVQQLTEPITYAENKTGLYNVNTFPVSAQPLGSKTILVRPSVTDTIAVRLSDATGIALMNKLQSNDENIQSSDEFLDYFKGIKISAGSAHAFALGFSDSVIMSLHYSKQGVVREQKTVDFTLANAAMQFNHISINRTGTALAALSASNSEIASAATNHAGYLQTGTGSIVKISFPHLRDLLTVKNYLKIEKAELIVKPVNGTFNGVYPLPPQLRLSETTQLNGFGSDITTGDNSGATQLGNLVIDDLYGLNTGYLYDITTYINTQIAIATVNKNGLFLSAPSPAFQSALNRVLVGDPLNTNGSIQLKLYYLTANQN